MNKNNIRNSLIFGGTAFYLFFNRNPNRVIEHGIVSPADGTIESIKNNRIDIFIGLLDVHYQVAPISGTVLDIIDLPNENKNIMVISDGVKTLTVERMGGILARSVRTFVKVGDTVTRGQRIGRILLGSHTSIYPILNPLVKVGDHIIYGKKIENYP